MDTEIRPGEGHTQQDAVIEHPGVVPFSAAEAAASTTVAETAKAPEGEDAMLDALRKLEQSLSAANGATEIVGSLASHLKTPGAVDEVTRALPAVLDELLVDRHTQETDRKSKLGQAISNRIQATRQTS